MPFLPPDRRLVIATHNPGKLREMQEILAPFGLDVTSAGALGIPEPEETGSSFSANAELKARHATQACGLWALADDSGLAVEALDGAPGIYSARWAGPTKDFTMAMQRIRTELEAKGLNPQGQPARFICALALSGPDGTLHAFEGVIEGRLTFPPRGEKGFGYDPIFIPEGEHRTFAEIAPEEKHRISHRARAFAHFARFMEQAA